MQLAFLFLRDQRNQIAFLLDTKMLQSSLASSNVPLLLLLCFITVEFVDSLRALVALLLDFVGTPRFFIVLPAALLDCVMARRPFISIDQSKKNLIGKEIKISLLLGGKSQVKFHANPIVHVVFPVPYLLGVLR